MPLFESVVDYSKDVFRNIYTAKPSQDLFDDLSDDADDWAAAIELDMATHQPIERHTVIQRGFDYSENLFISYPFENLTASRFTDGSVGCWYASESMDTTIHETAFHFVRNIRDSIEAFSNEKSVDVDRRIAKIACEGLAIDLSEKTKEYPWLIDPLDYSRCQEVGLRVAKEGHPLLRVRSARHDIGVNVAAFKRRALSDVRDHCYLAYSLDVQSMVLKITRDKEKIMQLVF